ncbi:MAG: transporter substrate-binding domain-containing protein [Spirochaetaceae bacterium]|nr:transporter substrate-binding domain-containing protein [Spirochaetaceae bacterium]
MKKVIIITFFVLLVFSISSQTTLTFPSTSNSGLNTVYSVIEAAYKELGMEINFVNVPEERSLVNANNGIFDGLPFRIEGIENEYTNLIPLKVPITNIIIYAYTRKSGPVVKSIDDLRNKRLVFVRGHKAPEQITAGYDVIVLKSIEQAFNMLLENHADVFVELSILGEVDRKRLNLSESIIYQEPPLRTIPTYHYLHKKNIGLIPEILSVLQEMKDSGRMQEIIDAPR